MSKIALFVDVQNVYYTTREAYGRRFDYNRFWRQATTNHEVVAAFAYAIDRGDAKQLQFQDILSAIGFKVRLKPYIQRQDGSSKGDWDVGITIDVMTVAPTVDRVVLVSGDGDFDLLAEKVRQDCGVQVDVYGVPGLTARSLVQAASRFVPIDGELLLPVSGRRL
ncbi:NYN domain-containing protein [Saccharospirillum alexandrii]|uniref:LabA-like NYN domain-containing protein n=1 Tax=Saccharospirillum alexandrii TaxID=2448477 RepID=UPI000FD94FB5|nr:NYN domain-containing protein [Saccharospirillum alexandrii]